MLPRKLTPEEREWVKEQTSAIDRKELTYDQLKKKLGVGINTVLFYHKVRLEEDVNRLKKQVDELSHTYKDTAKKLYAEREQLKQEVATLTEQKAELAHIFKDRNLTWQEGLILLKEVTDLHRERDTAKKELNSLKASVEETERIIPRLTMKKEKLQENVIEMGKTRFDYESWFQFEFPELQRKRNKLVADINILVSMKKNLEAQFKRFIDEKG